MQNWLRRQIRQKLSDYRVQLNEPDTALPEQLDGSSRVAVIGGGIAGISAAANLAERGFSVDIFEKAPFLGGKCGSWAFESNGEILRAEHGFHAFFRQYHNLRNFMKRIDAFKNLIPIDDYVIHFGNGETQGFKGIDPTPGLNVLDLRKKGVFNFLTFINPLSLPFLKLLSYDREKTFAAMDGENFESYARRTMMPHKMRVVFNSFARAFFAEPDKMSMAELIKGFHFYFLSNEDGLLYDVLDDDFQYSFIDPCINWLEKHGARIRLGEGVDRIERDGNSFMINGESFDYCVLCTDVKYGKPLVENSPDLHGFPTFHRQMTSLQRSDRYAVLRVWTDRFEAVETPFFVFTDRVECLDSITFYHRMEKSSREWSEVNKGGIYELHCYALPEYLTDDEMIKARLLDEFYRFFPELSGMKIRHEFFQHRHDFPAFHTGLYQDRPEVDTEVPGLYLAGDWVKMDNCSMLMEAAYTSGALAANHILSENGLRAHSLESVPLKGILA